MNTDHLGWIKALAGKMRAQFEMSLNDVAAYLSGDS